MERAPKRLKKDSSLAPDSQTSSILDAFTQLDQALSSNSNYTSTELRNALSNTGRALSVLEGAAVSNRSKLDANLLKQLEINGKQLWNRSSVIERNRSSTEEKEEVYMARRKLVAKLRHLSLRTIQYTLGVPKDTEETLLLLELITQTASSYLGIGSVNPVQSLEKDAASLANSFKDLSNLEIALRSRCASAVLDVLIFRIRLAIQTQSPVAQYIKGKADVVLNEEEIPPRKRQQIAETFYQVGTSLALEKRDGEDRNETVSGAIEWLKWANHLLTVQENKSTRRLRAAILRSLAFAQLQLEEAKTDAEVTQKELLLLEPTFARKRQLVKMIIARGGSDAEIVEAFQSLLSNAVADENQGLTHSLRFEILQALSRSTISAVKTETNVLVSRGYRLFLEQLFSIAAIIVKSSDFEAFSLLFSTTEQALPDFRLSPTSAFLVSTYVQAVINSTQGLGSKDAAKWLSLILTSPLAELDLAFLAQNARMIASKYIECKEYDRATELVEEWSKKVGIDSRTELLRYQIALLKKDSQGAIEYLESACSAPNFTSDSLVWAAHQANECFNEEVFLSVLEKVTQAVIEKKNVEGMDMLTAARLCLRMTLEKVEPTKEPIEVELFAPILNSLKAVARSLVGQDSKLPEDFVKGLTWIRLAAIEACSKFSSSWSCGSVTQLFESIAQVCELELSVSKPNEELLSNLFACRLASLAARASIVRQLSSHDQVVQYKSLLQALVTYLEQLVEADKTHSQHFSKLEFKKFVNATISLQAECHTVLDQWPNLLELVGSCEENDSSDEFSLIALRIICDKVSQKASTCPYEILSSIYRKTLSILYQNRALTSEELAIWLRMIIGVLIFREPEEAIKYLQNSQQLIAKKPDGYPKEEVSWLISTAWDYGIDLFTNNDSKELEAEKWCQLAISIARSANDSMMVDQLEEWLNSLKPQEEGVVEEIGEEVEGDRMDET
ncbi:hypothetical protein JCM5350_005624 [Sporobolomyces pararoseus]